MERQSKLPATKSNNTAKIKRQTRPDKTKFLVRAKANPNALPNGTGRPSIYDEVLSPELAFKFALLGATNVEIAAGLDIAESTLEDWISTYPLFRCAIKDGKEKADAEITERLYQRARGMKIPDVHISNYKGEITVTELMKEIPPDVRAMEYWLNNRQRGKWANLQKTDHTSTDGSMSPKESVIVLPAKAEVK